MKKWRVLGKLKKQKNKQLKNEEILGVLLENRGVKTEKEIKEFLNPPHPLELTAKDLEIDQKEILKALRRIRKAIESKEKIIVYGDYDTDGVCATAILWETLYNLGANVAPFIPKREEGYGLKVERIEEFSKEGVGLIITVDQGIVAAKQIEQAQKMGVDVIVTDHHLPGKEKPKALAVVHTTKLSGSGVSWFLAKNFSKPGLDLITIGTIADVMPLLGVNRAIVYYGLSAVKKTKRLGLQKLYEIAGIIPENIGTYEISFIIGPRLNASGRLDDPMDSLRLLLTRDAKRAADLALKIDQKNRERQLLTEKITAHARDLWLAQDGKSNLIFVSHESWEHGVVGLVAGKLVEEFYRPAVVVSLGEEYCRASARSIDGFNIIEALRTCSDVLGPHGGHPLAAGFTIELKKLEILKERLIRLAQEKLDPELLSPILKIDLELELPDVNFALFKNLEKLQPFGFGNPEPIFLTRNLTVLDAKTLGNSNQHLKLRVIQPEGGSRITFEAIGFGLGEFFSRLSPEKKIDLVYNIIPDEWNGKKRLQLKIKDLKINDGKNS